MARGAHPCIISMKGLETEEDRFVIPEVHELLTPLISVIPIAAFLLTMLHCTAIATLISHVIWLNLLRLSNGVRECVISVIAKIIVPKE